MRISVFFFFFSFLFFLPSFVPSVRWTLRADRLQVRVSLIHPDMFVFNYFTGCELKQGKEVTFNPEDDDFEHQLSVRMVREWSWLLYYKFAKKTPPPKKKNT